MAATRRNLVLADLVLTGAAVHPSEVALSQAARRFLSDILDSSVPAALTPPTSFPSPRVPRGPLDAGAPASSERGWVAIRGGVAWVTVCVGVDVDGVVVHAPGCRWPCFTTWPHRTDGISPECDALTRRVSGLA